VGNLKFPAPIGALEPIQGSMPQEKMKKSGRAPYLVAPEKEGQRLILTFDYGLCDLSDQFLIIVLHGRYMGPVQPSWLVAGFVGRGRAVSTCGILSLWAVQLD
jgi:hypothetical protein